MNTIYSKMSPHFQKIKMFKLSHSSHSAIMFRTKSIKINLKKRNKLLTTQSTSKMKTKLKKKSTTKEYLTICKTMKVFKQ